MKVMMIIMIGITMTMKEKKIDRRLYPNTGWIGNEKGYFYGRISVQVPLNSFL
jgi:hypothetical protein